MARKPDSAYRSTSDAQPFIAVNGTARETGGKRKGRRMRVKPSESRMQPITPERLSELVETFGTVQATVSRKGKRKYATLVTYYDESRKR